MTLFFSKYNLPLPFWGIEAASVPPLLGKDGIVLSFSFPSLKLEGDDSCTLLSF